MNPLVLFGPPASGKDTITTELHRQHEAFVLYRPMRSGPSSDRYRLLVAEAEPAAGDVLHTLDRYERRYLFDRPEVDRLLVDGYIPVLHIGQLAGVKRVHAAYPASCLVQLVCRRQICEQRSRSRADIDLPARLTAWDETQADLDAHPGLAFTLTIDTETVTPDAAARRIRHEMDRVDSRR